MRYLAKAQSGGVKKQMDAVWLRWSSGLGSFHLHTGINDAKEMVGEQDDL